MSTYFIGIISAFAEPSLHGWANILDNYLSNKLFNRLTPLVFFSACVGVVILPIIFILDHPEWISLRFATILFVISLVEVFYLFPYYWALRKADTSVVTSLFSLGKMFVPLLAFLFLGERLTGTQYAGFFIITMASITLTLDSKKIRFNKALVLMFAVSLLLAAQSILLKYAYDLGMSWGTSVVWMTAFQFMIAASLLLWRRKDSGTEGVAGKFRANWKFMFGAELLTWVGILAGSYALYLIPVSIVKGIGESQPIFVLIYALLFSRVWPGVFKERLDKNEIVKKAVSFAFVIAGVLMVTGI